MNIFTGLFLVLLVLKSLGTVSISWWLVFAPLIVPLVLILAVFVLPAIWRSK